MHIFPQRKLGKSMNGTFFSGTRFSPLTRSRFLQEDLLPRHHPHHLLPSRPVWIEVNKRVISQGQIELLLTFRLGLLTPVPSSTIEGSWLVTHHGLFA